MAAELDLKDGHARKRDVNQRKRAGPAKAEKKVKRHSYRKTISQWRDEMNERDDTDSEYDCDIADRLQEYWHGWTAETLAVLEDNYTDGCAVVWSEGVDDFKQTVPLSVSSKVRESVLLSMIERDRSPVKQAGARCNSECEQDGLSCDRKGRVLEVSPKDGHARKRDVNQRKRAGPAKAEKKVKRHSYRKTISQWRDEMNERDDTDSEYDRDIADRLQEFWKSWAADTLAVLEETYTGFTVLWNEQSSGQTKIDQSELVVNSQSESPHTEKTLDCSQDLSPVSDLMGQSYADPAKNITQEKALSHDQDGLSCDRKGRVLEVSPKDGHARKRDVNQRKRAGPAKAEKKVKRHSYRKTISQWRDEMNERDDTDSEYDRDGCVGEGLLTSKSEEKISNAHVSTSKPPLRVDVPTDADIHEDVMPLDSSHYKTHGCFEQSSSSLEQPSVQQTTQQLLPQLREVYSIPSPYSSYQSPYQPFSYLASPYSLSYRHPYAPLYQHLYSPSHHLSYSPFHYQPKLSPSLYSYSPTQLSSPQLTPPKPSAPPQSKIPQLPEFKLQPKYPSKSSPRQQTRFNSSSKDLQTPHWWKPKQQALTSKSSSQAVLSTHPQSQQPKPKIHSSLSAHKLAHLAQISEHGLSSHQPAPTSTLLQAAPVESLQLLPVFNESIPIESLQDTHDSVKPMNVKSSSAETAEVALLPEPMQVDPVPTEFPTVISQPEAHLVVLELAPSLPLDSTQPEPSLEAETPIAESTWGLQTVQLDQPNNFQDLPFLADGGWGLETAPLADNTWLQTAPLADSAWGLQTPVPETTSGLQTASGDSAWGLQTVLLNSPEVVSLPESTAREVTPFVSMADSSSLSTELKAVHQISEKLDLKSEPLNTAESPTNWTSAVLLKVGAWVSGLFAPSVNHSSSKQITRVGAYQVQEVVFENDRCSVVLALPSMAVKERVACKLTAPPAYLETDPFALSPIGLEWNFYTCLQAGSCPSPNDGMMCRHDLILRALTAVEGIECTYPDGSLYTTNLLVLEEAAASLDALLLQGPFREAHALVLFENLLLAVGTLHLHKICHRDLKPCQILFSKEGTLKLADLDSAAFFEDFRTPRILNNVTKESDNAWELEMLADGTDEWRAPEVEAWAKWQWEEVRPPYYGVPKAADLWGCGQILACMLLGVDELGANSSKNLHTVPNLSGRVCEMLSGIFETDPTHRYDMASTRQLLAQYWADFGKPSDAEVISEVMNRLHRPTGTKINARGEEENEGWMVVKEADTDNSWTLV